jgi:hypothetical protein
MEGYCSTGQSSQLAVVPMEEEEGGAVVSVFYISVIKGIKINIRHNCSKITVQSDRVHESVSNKS